MSHRIRPVLLLVAILMTVVVGEQTASATPPHREEARQERQVTPLLRLLPQLWSTLGKSWQKRGSSLDPFGQPAPADLPEPPASEIDEGSSLDPFGTPRRAA